MRLALSLMIIVTAAVGCGGSDSKDSNELNLTGTWRSSVCQSEGEGGMLQTAVFTANTLDYLVTNYDSADCAESSKQSSFRLVGTYKTGIQAASQAKEEGATAIDITISDLKKAIYQQSIVDAWQGTGICGVKPVKDVEFSVSKAQCAGSDDGVLFDAGGVYYQIFKASNADLVFGKAGDTLNGSTAELRPIALQQTPMTRISG